MSKRKILTRDNVLVDEQKRSLTKEFDGLTFCYDEVYYLDYEVDENTGVINKSKLVNHYTGEQTTRNLKAMKSAYHIAKGAASPSEIVSFREKYQIAASVLSQVLGFSKNTISNIEKEGVSSLTSGRLIKLCLNNKTVLSQYIEISSFLDAQKKKELLKKLAS